MTQGTGTAEHIDTLMRQIKLHHRRHGNHRERLIDFVEINGLRGPACRGKQFLHGKYRCGRKPVGRLGVGGMGDDTRQRLASQLRGAALAHQHQGGCTVVDRGATGRCDGATLFFKRGS